ncbi:hypothetical protein AAHA92_11871 [Salvia divinorum]|uniref:Uncharacterized protein n=1 Tax=Salvia divinorum TaxID=28513 RepID=A0ABD1HIF6_SALDI
MSPKHHLYDLSQNHPFMTCVVRVDTQSRWHRWQRTVTRVLNKCHGLHSFRMNDDGVVEISGTVDPSLLLKMLERAGRSAELCWLNFGQCSRNLFMPTSGGSTYSYDGRYLHAPSHCRPKPPSAILPSINNQNYSSDYDSMYYDKHGYDHGHGYRHRHQQGYEYQSGYSHGGCQTQIHGNEDIECCRVM